jgi:hypothetical protein
MHIAEHNGLPSLHHFYRHAQSLLFCLIFFTNKCCVCVAFVFFRWKMMHTYLHLRLSQICVKLSCFFVMHVHLHKCVHHNKQLHSLPHVYVERHHVCMELGAYSGYKPETSIISEQTWMITVMLVVYTPSYIHN